MRRLLEDTLAYLILKRKQASIVLSFPSYYHNGQRARTEIELREQERKYISMRMLNNKGSARGQISIEPIGVLRESSYRVRTGRQYQVRQNYGLFDPLWRYNMYQKGEKAIKERNRPERRENEQRV